MCVCVCVLDGGEGYVKAIDFLPFYYLFPRRVRILYRHTTFLFRFNAMRGTRESIYFNACTRFRGEEEKKQKSPSV